MPTACENAWQRPVRSKGSELLTTHPKERRCVQDLQKLIPEAMERYPAAASNHGLGEVW